MTDQPYRHPARTMSFDELVAGLTREVDAGNVRMKTDRDLALFGYTEQCVFDKLWTPFSMMARGLILDMQARRIVATPFTKFFNVSENGIGIGELPNEPFTVTDKLDGSLGIVHFHDGQWRVATRGSFSSEQAIWATEWLRQHVMTDRLRVGVTYLAEIIYAANRIVVPYGREGLVILAAFEENGEETDCTALRDEALYCGFDWIAPQREFTHLSDILTLAETLPRDEEGFVVRFASGLRVKVKGAEYVRLHRLVSNVTPLAIFDMLVASDDLDATAKQLPEEFRRDFDAIRDLLEQKADALFTDVQALAVATAAMTDKELGLWMPTQTHPAARWIFAWRKKDFAHQFWIGGSKLRRSAFDAFRPTGNRLDGYTPSTSINRFSEEQGA